MAAQPAHVLLPLSDLLASEAELLNRYVRGSDEDAFAVLVARHGPMVLGVCRRLLGADLAEDVAQATFLALARQAATIRRPEGLAAWLHQTARRLALRQRRTELRRRLREARTSLAPAPGPLDELSAREWLAILDEEVQRLPLGERLPLLLCCLEGASKEEAARQLGCTVGALKGRLERARARLHARLTRRGLTLSAALLAAEAAQGSCGLPAGFLVTLRAPAPRVVAIAAGAVRGTGLFKVLAAALVVAGVIAAGVAALARPQVQRAAAPPRAAERQPRLDRHGDPLPEGAVARLGTVRWRLDWAAAGSLAFSPDGKVLVTGGTQLVFWDAATGNKLRCLPGDSYCVQVRRLERFPDGPVVLATDGRSTVRFWDLASGKVLGNLRLPPELGARIVCVAPDGKTLAVRHLEGRRTALVDVATGKVLHRIEVKGAIIQDLAFSPDGKTLAVGTLAPSVQMWNVTGGTLVRGFDHHKGQFVSAVAFSPDGKTIASGSGGLIVLSDVRTGKLLARLEARMRTVNHLAFSRDGKTLVSRTEGDGKVCVWDVAARKLRFTLEVPYGRVLSLALSPDGKRLAAGTDTCTLRLWDVETGKALATELGENTLHVQCVAFTPDGKHLLAGTDSRPIRLWDTATWKPAGAWKGSARSLSFSPDGKRLASVPAYEEAIHLWATDTGKCVSRLPHPGTSYVWRAVFCGAGARVVAVDSRRVPGEKGVAHLVTWDAGTGRAVGDVALPGVVPESLALAPDDRTAFVGDTGGNVHVCDLQARRVSFVLRGHRHYVAALALSPDGRKLLSTSYDSGVRLWEVATGREVFALKGHRRAVTAAACCPHGRLLATAGGTLAYPYPVTHPPAIRLWDVASGREVGQFRGHDCDVTSLAFSPDGARLAAGLSNSCVLVWEVPDPLRRRPPARRLGAAELNRLWDDLAEQDAARAHRAVWSLADNPDEALAFLKGRLRPVPAPDEKQIRRWIADLDSDRFAEREAASRNLERQGELVESALAKVTTGKASSAEARRRAKELLKKLAGPLTAGEQVRGLRGVEVLEHAATKEARRLLEVLAGGAPRAHLTREAKAALRRLSR